jgi:hypothetical protein
MIAAHLDPVGDDDDGAAQATATKPMAELQPGSINPRRRPDND